MNLHSTLFITLGVLSFSCKKSDPAPTVSNMDLISKTWKLTATTINSIDAYSLLADCEKDNLFVFTKDGNFTEDEGPTKCNASDPQTIETAKWSFPSGSTLKSVYPDNTSQKVTINQLTPTTFKFTFIDTSDPSNVVTTVTTFTVR